MVVLPTALRYVHDDKPSFQFTHGWPYFACPTTQAERSPCIPRISFWWPFPEYYPLQLIYFSRVRSWQRKQGASGEWRPARRNPWGHRACCRAFSCRRIQYWPWARPTDARCIIREWIFAYKLPWQLLTSTWLFFQDEQLPVYSTSTSSFFEWKRPHTNSTPFHSYCRIFEPCHGMVSIAFSLCLNHQLLQTAHWRNGRHRAYTLRRGDFSRIRSSTTRLSW